MAALAALAERAVKPSVDQSPMSHVFFLSNMKARPILLVPLIWKTRLRGGVQQRLMVMETMSLELANMAIVGQIVLY